MSRIAACALWLCLGCSPETRVDVFFEAEPALAEAASSIEVRVVDTEGDTVLDTVEPLAERGLPVAVRLEPAGGDATRSFLVVAHLRDSGGERIARVAAGGEYSAGEARQLRLRFTGDCAAGLDCDGATTCVTGACVDACSAGTSACGPRDGGTPGDAGVGAPDGGDAGSGADAGTHEPAYVQRAVGSTVAETSGVWESALADPITVDASGGPWLVLASAAIASDPSVAGGARARLMVDGAEAVIGGASSSDGSAGPWAGFALLGSGSSHTVDVEVSPTAVGMTATLSALRVVAFPLPAGADVQLDEALEGRLIPTGGWETLSELRFTPERSGRYLILAAVSATPTPAGPVGVRLEDGGGGLWPVADGDPPHLAGVAGDRQTYLLMRAPTLSAGAEARFTLQLSAGNPNSMASHARVLAVELGGFATTVHDEQLGADTTSSPEPDVVATADAPAGPVRDWIVLSSIALRADGLRGARLGAPDLTRRYDHTQSAGTASYPSFGALSTADAFTADAAAFGSPVDHREAVVHVLALP